jgi:prepilin-type N-terminal cleavage/methylation domain-containing protein
MHKKQRGFSMVELLIAMLLSVTLAAGIVTIFVNNRHSFRQDDNIARMQDDARHALREIAFDISMAGHYGDLHLPNAVNVDGGLSIGVDCGPAGDQDWMYWATDPTTGESLSLAAVDNATDLTVAVAHSCFAGGELRDGTDVVSIKRVAGAQTATPSAGNVYLRTNGTVGFLFKGPAPTAAPVAVVAPSADWQFRPSIYFIREFANAPGDGIPTLCRKIMDGAGPAMTTECLATGIENLQIEYGIDTSLDGHPNVYISNPTVTQMQNVIAARIFLVARTTEIDVRYTNDKTYSVSNSPDFEPDDSFHRRVFSISVSIRNIRNLNIMGL